MTNTGRGTVLAALLNFHSQQNERNNPFALVDLVLDTPRLQAFVKNALVQAESATQLDLASVDSRAAQDKAKLADIAADFGEDLKTVIDAAPEVK
jgi:hypothetical protein